jgi:hypothetical protein
MKILRPLFCWTRPLALVLALLGAAGSAAANPADATDDAFGALLAMPGAQPREGGWITPKEVEAAADDKALIAAWQRAKKDGAEFNAMRHRGTLLAHAIRTGHDSAALWLLRNGADPKKALFDRKEDAYALARKYHRTAVASALEAQHGFEPPRPAAARATTATQGPVKAAAALTGTQQSIAKMKELAGPVLQPNAQAQQTWRRHAATLSQDEFRAIFENGDNLDLLVILTRDTDSGLEESLARLPVELVRQHAQRIADLLAEWSFVTYGEHHKIAYTGASRNWPALWRRLDQPLQYDKWPELAARVPPELWPGLFASGYPQHDAEATGCVLAAVDLPALQALWPEFQREFTNARDEAAGLVLAAYRIAQDRSPCYYGSSQADTAAKLAFLRASGVTAPAWGLRPAPPNEPLEPALSAMVQAFSPKQAAAPRLLGVAPACKLSLDERWWKALAKVRSVGWGIPPANVQLVDAPGIEECGLLVSGNAYEEWPRYGDDFDAGPSMDPPLPRCADAPDDGEMWAAGPDGVRRIAIGMEARGALTELRTVRDRETGKRYVLDAGQQGAWCTLSHQLPHAFEWQAGDNGPKLVPSRDDALVTRLLRRQCHPVEDSHDVTCPDVEQAAAHVASGMPVLDRLRAGDEVPLRELLDALGSERRAAYRAALAGRDHARLRQLLDDGLPAWWTSAEIEALAKAEFPLEEKRRRVALLFANAGQLSDAMHLDEYDLASSLATWLPRQDWKPVLRLIASNPNAWFDMEQRLRGSVGEELACDLDRAEQFLCGGGVATD